MVENFDSNGIWFLPTSEEDKIAGKITYSLEGGIYLELLGTFGDLQNSNLETYNEIILGILKDGKKITLLNCSVVNRTINFPGIPTVKFLASYMLIGEHYSNKEQLLFDEISIEYHNLNDWLEVTGIEERNLSTNEFNLTYLLPEEIKFKIKNFDSKFSFSANTESDKFKTFKLTQNVKLILQRNTSVDIFELLRESFVFQGFLTFGTFESCYPTKIQLKNSSSYEVYNEYKNYNTIELYYKSNINKSKKQKKPFEFLFTFSDVASNFQLIVNNWYENDSKLEPIIYLFLNSFYSQNSIFSENIFLEIIHALETFHRRIFKNYVISKEEYSMKKQIILDSVPENHREWLENKLNFGNEPSLHERLVELLSVLEEFTFLQELIPDKNDFVKKVKNSRNYYTHYDLSLQKKALKGASLFYITIKLRVILITHLLLLLGFENEKINIILQKLKDYHYNYLIEQK